MIIDLIVGCRPNFVKAAAIIEASKKFPQITVRLVHTGQHSESMSDPFFEELRLPKPFGFSKPRHNTRPGERLGDMISNLSTWWWTGNRPTYVMVVGDTDSTLAGALAAKKAGLKLVHVEAGLRCGDDQMQEEINRKLVDSVSDVLYASTQGAVDNLIREGKKPWSIVFAGNVMADTLLSNIARAVEKYPATSFPSRFALLTLHRAEAVDHPTRMEEIMDGVSQVSKTIPVLFPKHPRGHFRVYNAPGYQMQMVEPMGYLQFISAMHHAHFVMTDSGGVQEETTILGTPCITLRNNTERPETVHFGTNRIAGTSSKDIIVAAKETTGSPHAARCPEKWDGQAGERILRDLEVRG